MYGRVLQDLVQRTPAHGKLIVTHLFALDAVEPTLQRVFVPLGDQGVVVVQALA